jgi:hypothetical protein
MAPKSISFTRPSGRRHRLRGLEYLTHAPVAEAGFDAVATGDPDWHTSGVEGRGATPSIVLAC